MPPPINPGDHVLSEEVLDSFLCPFAVKIKPFNIPISTRHLAIFKGRPVAPNELPFSKGMIWQHHEVPKLGIHYEYGLHLSPKVVPIGKFLSDHKWRKYRKRHYHLVPAATNLQSACLRALHRSSGPRVVRHYHLQHIRNVPLLFAHSYVYEIYTKSDSPTPNLVNCYTLRLVIKYRADYDSPLVRLYWTSADYNQAPCITNHNWALWNVYDSMYRIVQDQLLRSKALRSTRCRCCTCLYFSAMYREIVSSLKSHQHVINSQLARLAYYEPDPENLKHDCGQICCRHYQQTIHE